MSRVALLLSAALLLPCAATRAIQAADTPPPSPAAVRAANPPANPSASSPAVLPTVRQGRVTAVDAAGQRVEIDGTWWRFAEGQTRVYRQGRAASPAVLASGQAVSFSAAGEKGVLGAVYVQ